MKFIDNIKQSPKMLSVQLGTLGVGATGFLVASPDAALQLWNAIPDSLKAMIPVQYVPLVGVLVSLLSVVSRLIKQKNIQATDVKK